MANVDVETLLVKLEGRITDFEKKMAKAQGVANSAAGKIEGTMTGLTGRVNKALGLLGVGFSVAALVSKARTAIGELGDLADAATQAGISAEGLQVFRKAVSQAGGDSEDADKALVKFNKSMGDVAITGKGPVADALKSVGININDAGFKSANTEKKFGIVVERLSGIKDQAKLASVAGDIFGDKLGPKLLGVLAQGQQGLIDTEEQMRRLHQLISNDMVQAGDTLDDRFKDWALTIDSVFKSVVVASADAVSDLAKNMQTISDDINEFTRSPSMRNFLAAMLGKEFVNSNVGRQFLRGFEGKEQTEKGLSFDPAKIRAAEQKSMDALANLRAEQARKAARERPDITITPVDHAAETKAQSEREAAQKKIDTVTKSLEHQQAQLGRTSREQEIYNSLQAAGVDITDKAGQNISQLAGELYDLQVAQAAVDSLAGSAFDLFQTVISGTEDAGQAVLKFIQQLVLAEARAAFLNAFNPSSQLGPIGTLLGGLLGAGRAGGGPVSPGTVYPVGERGPELFAPNVSGRIIPNGAASGNSRHLIELSLTPEVDARILRVSGPQALGISVQVSRENNRRVRRQQETSG